MIGHICVPMVLLMYMMVFNPPVFGFNCVWIVMAVSLLYTGLNFKWIREHLDFKRILTAEIIAGALLAWGMAMALLNRNTVTEFAYIVYWMAGDIPFAVSCWVFLQKKGLGFEELLDHILWAGVVMAVTALAAFFFKPAKDLFTGAMESYGIPYVKNLSVYRHYGLAANLTSTASYVQAMLACIALYRGLRGRPGWLAAFPALAFAGNLNSRTSIFMMMAGMAAVFFAQLFSKSPREIGETALAIALAVAAAWFGKELVRLVQPETYKWLINGMDQVTDLVKEGKTGDGYFERLMQDIRNLPKGSRLFFGVGLGILTDNKYGVISEVGFVEDMWRGGLVFTLPILFLYGRTLWRILRCKALEKRDGIFFAGLFFVIFLINNVKGSFFIHSDVMSVIWMTAAALLWNREGKDAPAGTAIKES